MSDSNIRIRNNNTINNKNNNSNSHNDDNNIYIKIDNKNNYTSRRNAEYLANDLSDRSCNEWDCDSSRFGNTLPPKQLKYTQLLWANTPVQCVTRIPADINGTVIFNVKSSNRVSLLPSCQDGRLWKHDSRSDWSGYRSVRYRDWAGSKMFNKDECIFYINFGERNQKHFDNSLIVLALRNTLIVTHVSTPILSRTQNLIHTIMDNIHAKQRTTNDPGHHQWLTMFLRWIRLWHLHRCKPIVPLVSFPYRGISQSKEDSKWKNKVEKSSATKWWYRSRGYS